VAQPRVTPCVTERRAAARRAFLTGGLLQPSPARAGRSHAAPGRSPAAHGRCRFWRAECVLTGMDHLKSRARRSAGSAIGRGDPWVGTIPCAKAMERRTRSRRCQSHGTRRDRDRECCRGSPTARRIGCPVIPKRRRLS